ncbi:unnamed protein product [Cyprideis torosa]|uniref:Uncharacterized protein n=1 Tax=Cyprideis torosa TaxID=163714 RepID=A0A7R8ZJU0_9CRUS|nr:unnamed protein product [Cyprideis torosa]CAG0878816.1 unnamed protein product [Cyprideis torosa]
MFTAAAWAIGLLIFFPILWTILTSFKTEAQAISDPPVFFFFDWTLENYSIVQERSDYMKYLWNSVIIAGGSTLLGVIVAIPAAWSMAFTPSKRTKDILLWMLSTKMLPAVGVLYPIYLLFIQLGLLDSRAGLVIVLMLINLPIIIWMLYTYFREIPGEILEAARMDGATLRDEILYVLTPMALPGIASTVLLNIILAWNEAFWTLNLTAAQAAPLTAFIASYSSPEGLFFAKLSAASTMAIAPILILGWFSQKQLVRGLTFGAINGKEASNEPPAKRGLAMVFQSYALYPHMTVRKNIAFPLRMAKLDKPEIDKRVDYAAQILNLTDYLDRRPGQLSGGQRQRVAIGRAIVREPAAFLFDEPLSNLDAALRVGMRMEISELHKRLATTMIYVTHDQVEAMTMADKIVVLHAGVIEQVGSPLELYRTPRNRFVAGFIGSPKMNFIEGSAAAKHGAHTIGIRPEHINVADSGGEWSGVVGVSEHLGSDTFFHVHETGLAETITVRADGEVGFKHGDSISLTPRAEMIHKFDAQGLRIGD